MKTLAILAVALMGFACTTTEERGTSALEEPVSWNYFWVFLEATVDAPALTPERAAEMQQRHLEHLSLLMENGTNKMAGPLGDAGDIRGIAVIHAATEGELRAAFANDPYVAAGHLELRALRWQIEVGKIGRPAQPPEMGTYTLGVVYADGFSSSAARTEVAKLTRALAADGDLLAFGGPLVQNEQGPNGVLAFRTADIEAVEALLRTVPEVKSGALRVKLFPLYLLKGFLESAR